MSGKRKGIKRHESLYPLSHHHHHALVLALKLKQAGTERSNMPLVDLKEEVIQFWENGGQQHFREEEEILLPAYAQVNQIEDQPVIGMMLVEHVKIRALVNQLSQKETVQADVLNELGMLLDAHIRAEERVVFPMIEKALPEEKLNELSAFLHVNHHED